MNQIKWVFLVLLGLMLTGCGHQIITVKETEIVVLTPPANLLKDCEPTVPPAKEKYVELTAREKEEALTEFGRGQTAVIRQCNKDKKSLREWVTKEVENQKKAEKEKNASRK